MAVIVPATYNALAIQAGGIAVEFPDFDHIYTSPLAISTFGFIYGPGDMWMSCGDCATVVWTPCEDAC